MNEFVDKTVKFIKGLPVIEDIFEKRPKVAVFRFAGVIADNQKKNSINHPRFAKDLDKLQDRDGLAAIALLINCPGGSAAQTSLLANHIRRIADEKNLPVFAFVEDVAASGGYWLACTADEIYAQDCSIVGSIGVIAASFGFEDFIEKHGVHRRLYTAGKDKSFMDPFSPQKEDDIDRLQDIQKDIHGSFKDWVKDRRGEKINGSDKDLFEGQFWTAGPALDKGMIDGFGDARMILREKYGERVKLIDMTPEKKFSIPLLGGIHATISTDDILSAAEDKGIWSRYGL